MNPHSHNSTTKDLFELASLDALGLLSDDERRAFEDAFAAASPLLQSQIRDQQSRMAEMEAILPRVEPPAGLRARVLAAVQAAIDAAMPGRAGRLHEGGRGTPRLLPSRGVNAVWRGLAIGAAAAAIVFGVVSFQVFNENKALSEAYASNTLTDMLLKEFGPRFERSLLSPSTKFVQFEPAGAQRSGGLALLLMDEQEKTAQFFCKNLPASSGTYSLVVVDDRGNHVGDALVKFRYNGTGIAHSSVPFTALGGRRLALVAPADVAQPGAEPILRSTTH